MLGNIEGIIMIFMRQLVAGGREGGREERGEGGQHVS